MVISAEYQGCQMSGLHSYLYETTADPEIASDPNGDACPDRDVVGHGLSR